jgi:YHS domain-containing protein
MLMTFLARVVQFLFWLLVVSWGVRLLRRIVGGMLRNAATAPRQTAEAPPTVAEPGTSRRLVRDPVCGMHVDETLSIPLRVGSELTHFCSIACRDKYVGNNQKMAANS